jgi:hypothetical protein
MTLTLLAQTEIPQSLYGWLTGSAVTVLALGVLSFIRGWIVPGATYSRCLAEKDALETELRTRAREDRETLIPALTRATDVLARQLERRVDNTPPPPSKGR